MTSRSSYLPKYLNRLCILELSQFYDYSKQTIIKIQYFEPVRGLTAISSIGVRRHRYEQVNDRHIPGPASKLFKVWPLEEVKRCAYVKIQHKTDNRFICSVSAYAHTNHKPCWSPPAATRSGSAAGLRQACQKVWLAARSHDLVTAMSLTVS